MSIALFVRLLPLVILHYMHYIERFVLLFFLSVPGCGWSGLVCVFVCVCMCVCVIFVAFLGLDNDLVRF